MSLSELLSDEQLSQLNERAKSLGVDPNELAKAAVVDLISRPSDDFEKAAQYVLEKNRELYKRLSK